MKQVETNSQLCVLEGFFGIGYDAAMKRAVKITGFAILVVLAIRGLPFEISRHLFDAIAVVWLVGCALAIIAPLVTESLRRAKPE